MGDLKDIRFLKSNTKAQDVWTVLVLNKTHWYNHCYLIEWIDEKAKEQGITLTDDTNIDNYLGTLKKRWQKVQEWKNAKQAQALKQQ